jgi:hypothetical protein
MADEPDSTYDPKRPSHAQQTANKVIKQVQQEQRQQEVREQVEQWREGNKGEGEK